MSAWGSSMISSPSPCCWVRPSSWERSAGSWVRPWGLFMVVERTSITFSATAPSCCIRLMRSEAGRFMPAITASISALIWPPSSSLSSWREPAICISKAESCSSSPSPSICWKIIAKPSPIWPCPIPRSFRRLVGCACTAAPVWTAAAWFILCFTSFTGWDIYCTTGPNRTWGTSELPIHQSI